MRATTVTTLITARHNDTFTTLICGPPPDLEQRRDGGFVVRERLFTRRPPRQVAGQAIGGCRADKGKQVHQGY